MSLKEVAQRAGTSVGTVSLVLNNKDSNVRISEVTRHAVLEAARELGYTPNIAARRLRKGESQPITISLAWALDTRFSLVSRVLRGIQRYSESADGEIAHEVLIQTFPPGHLERLVKSHMASHAHGLVIGNSTPEDDQFLETHEMPIPVVRFQRSSERHSAVNVDGFRASRQVVDYLTGLGHRRIGLINPEVASSAVRNRLDGFAARMAELGLADHWSMADGPFTEIGGASAAEVLLRKVPRPTAIFALSDTMAVGALHTARRLGFAVPTDLSVVGYDDSDGSAFAHPPLTTVRVPIEEMGTTAAKFLTDHMQRRLTEPTSQWFQCELVIRESCAPPKSDPEE